MSRVFFNGVDLKATYNFVVQTIDDPFNIDVPTVELSARDGAIYFDDLARVDRRTITLRGQIYGTSHPDVMSKIIGLKKLIASSNNRGKLSVEFNDGGTIKTKYMYVQLSGEIWNSNPIGARAGFLAANLTIKFEAIDKPYWIVESSNNNVVIGPLTNLKYDGTWRKEFSWKLEPYTVVNLLGKYGNFEVDSNGDGLADGWSIQLSGNPTLVTSFDGSKAQKISFTNNGSSWIYIRRIITTDPNRILNRTFFFRSYAKTSYGGTATGNEAFPRSLYLVGRNNTNTWIQLISLLFDWNVWNCKYGTCTFTNPSITNLSIVGFYVGYPDNPVDSFFEAIVDKMMLVDLTAMGALPSGLQAFFSSAGITKWEELATTSNITGADGRTQTGEEWLDLLLPYVDSIATLGWKWGE